MRVRVDYAVSVDSAAGVAVGECHYILFDIIRKDDRLTGFTALIKLVGSAGIDLGDCHLGSYRNILDRQLVHARCIDLQRKRIIINGFVIQHCRHSEDTVYRAVVFIALEQLEDLQGTVPAVDELRNLSFA